MKANATSPTLYARWQDVMSMSPWQLIGFIYQEQKWERWVLK